MSQVVLKNSPDTSDKKIKLSIAELFEIYESLGFPHGLIAQWASVETDLNALALKIEERRPKNILEVGTFVGVATIVMAQAAPPDAHIHTIDPNLPLDEEMEALKSNLSQLEHSLPTQQIARMAAERAGVAHKITWHAGGFSTGDTYCSRNVAARSPVVPCGEEIGQKHGPFDFILIDGLHYADAVLSDLELAENLLVPGGVIALDDTLDLRWGAHVRRGLYEFLKNRKSYIFYQDRRWDPLMDVGFLEHFPPGKKNYQLDSEYDEDFYDRCLDMHAQVVPYLARKIFELIQPKSVIDLGCGAGIWLRAFDDLGVRDLVGLDGSRQAIEKRNRGLSDLVSIFDLRNVYRPLRRFDLCLCLDVIEHIEPEYEERLIESMVNCSDTIIFSSPPPGQGGDGHVNERPIAHWVDLFWKRGYVLCDVLRPHFEGATHIPQTTYQLNFYLVKRLFRPEDVRENNSPLSMSEIYKLLQEKESRIEDLFLQNVFLGRAVESERQEVLRSSQELSRQVVSLDEVLSNFPVEDFIIPIDRIKAETSKCFLFSFQTPVGKLYSRILKSHRYVLRENGNDLLLGNTTHADIREKGGGRYSFWTDHLYFSSSDGTDPRTNGRTYSFTLPVFIADAEKMYSK